ncbi:MAG: MBOAT family protein [Vallitalea sp.]|nr:MBOAT family protein [Vallitalea sp.]
MIFSSLMFLIYFMPVFLFLYFALPKYRNIILLVFSIIFYSFGEPVYIVLLFFSSSIDYILSRKLQQTEENYKRKVFLWCSILLNVLLLGFFKYSDFLISTINYTFNMDFNLLKLPLPIGISFYTFQTMSYTIDVYKNNVKANKSYLNFLMYVSMFPQLIAGPIVRYVDIEKDLDSRIVSIEKFDLGTKRLIIGLAKKVILADSMNLMYIDLMKASPSQLGYYLAYLAYGLHIYFDFSGYSDMAIGLGKMIGFDFLENFNYPYISKSISEVFRRWHISLGTWFREYVYIPLGGSKVVKWKIIRNLICVWLITGLWHGASTNYILWGLYFSIFIIAEKTILRKISIHIPTMIRHVYVCIIMIFSWVIFANTDMNIIRETYSYMFGVKYISLISKEMIFTIRNYSVLLIISLISATPVTKKLFNKIPDLLNNLIYIILFILCICIISDSNYSPFIYFRF